MAVEEHRFPELEVWAPTAGTTTTTAAATTRATRLPSPSY